MVIQYSNNTWNIVRRSSPLVFKPEKVGMCKALIINQEVIHPTPNSLRFHLPCNIAMLHNIIMPHGKSGRIVLEVDPDEKQDLYHALEKDGLTLKDWFLGRAHHYLQNRNQTELQFAESDMISGGSPLQKEAK